MRSRPPSCALTSPGLPGFSRFWAPENHQRAAIAQVAPVRRSGAFRLQTFLQESFGTGPSNPALPETFLQESFGVPHPTLLRRTAMNGSQ
jgi:hypothetical protein